MYFSFESNSTIIRLSSGFSGTVEWFIFNVCVAVFSLCVEDVDGDYVNVLCIRSRTTVYSPSTPSILSSGGLALSLSGAAAVEGVDICVVVEAGGCVDSGFLKYLWTGVGTTVD